MKRIIFTGAQSTGKSTMLNIIPIKNKITEVVRNLSKSGIKINREGDEDGQAKIFETYEKLLGKQRDYVSDRGLIDVTAYTIYLNTIGKVSDQFMNNQLERLKEFTVNNPDIVYVYFPVEFPLVEDGVRDNDDEFRDTIDVIISSLLDQIITEYGDHEGYITISGSVEQRAQKLISLLEVMEAGEDLQNLSTII